MSKKDMLDWFATNSTSLTVLNIILIMCIGILASAVIFFTYKITYTGVNYSLKFNASNVAILLITIVIMLMISSNIVISLGMVGALSIVRFRTAIKDPRDTVFIFWSIVEGLCIGSQNFKLAAISVLVIAIILVLFSFPIKKDQYYLLIIRGDGTVNASAIEQCLNEYALRFKVRTVNSTENSVEMIYEMKVKKQPDLEMSQQLQKLDGINSVNWLLESGENVG